MANAENEPTAYAISIATGDTVANAPVGGSNGFFRIQSISPGTYKAVIRDTAGRSYESPTMELLAGQDAEIGTEITLQFPPNTD